MAVEPELLCLDEPFSALDVLSAEALRGELMELWLKKKIPTKAILMVTHNIEEAVLMADRIVIMGKDPGHIVTEIPVTLRQPRQRKDTAFQGLVDKVYAAVAGQSRPKEETLGTPPGAAWLDPSIAECAAQRPRRLARETRRTREGGLTSTGSAVIWSSNSMIFLPIVESGELLGFVTVSRGRPVTYASRACLR